MHDAASSRRAEEERQHRDERAEGEGEERADRGALRASRAARGRGRAPRAPACRARPRGPADELARQALGVGLRQALGAIDQRQLLRLLLRRHRQLGRLELDLALEQLSLRLHETYSPAAIEAAPASRPERPASSTNFASALAPAKPMTRLRFDTRPSLTPKTAARRVPPPPERCQRSACHAAVACRESSPSERAWLRSSGARAAVLSSWPA